AIEAYASLPFGLLVRTVWPRVIFRNHALVLRQDVDAEAPLGVKMGMGARAVIHAYQQQERSQRHRRKRVGRHAMNLAIEIHGDDGHARGKGSHRSAKFECTEAHAVPGFWWRDCLH